MSASWIVAGLLLLYLVISVSIYYFQPHQPSQDDLRRKKHAVVVVLGDLGHSPRMCFQALSIARCGWKVTLVGYVESNIMQEVMESDMIEIKELPVIKRTGSFLTYAIKRVISQHLQLFHLLRSVGQVDVIMVQNPPAIPTLGVARLYCLFIRPGTKLLIDWHNLGYTILRMGVSSISVVRLYRVYEMVFGRIAYLHLCVSTQLGVALRHDLKINAKRILPLYDRPWKSYAVENATERANIRASLSELASSAKRKWVVTSTSYTPDEDLDMLLDALALYDDKVAKTVPTTVIVTGKGPMKQQFLESMTLRNFKHIEVFTLWLSYEQYHQLLSVSDVGISLHKSSSGWDLPMKVVDMFGAGLPVLALSYAALPELVNEENGLVFTDAKGLFEALEKVFTVKLLYARIRVGALKESQDTWFEHWKQKVGPVFGYGRYTGIESSSSSDSD